jgi:hypothetical protein
MKKEKTTETTERVTYIEGEEGHKVDGIVRRYIRRLFSRYEGNIGYASTFNSQTGRTHTRTSVASFSSYDVEQDICRILWECITGDRDNELSALVRDELTDANLERIRKTLCVASRRRFLDLLTQAEQTPLRFVSDTNELERIAFDTDLIPEKGDADADDISYQQIEATYMTQIQ